MTSEINRRGLLGLFAAAPVAALAKPGSVYASGGMLEGAAGFALVGEHPSETLMPRGSGWAISEGRDFELLAGPNGQRLALLYPKTVERLASPVDIETPSQRAEESALPTDEISFDVLDYPTAWAIQRRGGLTHESRCSCMPGWDPISGPGFLCDCGSIVTEWERLRDEQRVADILKHARAC